MTTRIGRMARGADLGWVAEALADRRAEILGRWREVTSRQPFHLGRRAPAVADHIPALFDAIVALLRRTAPSTTPSDAPLEDPDVLEAAQEHARVRFEQGLSGSDVVTEFRLLRQEIGRAIRAEVDDDAPTGDVVGAELLVHDALDGAIALALSALSVHLEELREEFLATTVHDVQQPITVLKGNAQLAMRQLRQPQPDLEAACANLRRIEAQADRMSLLLGVLGDASRLTLGRLEPRPESVDLGAVAHDILAGLDAEAAERLSVAVAPGVDLRGEWDRGMMERVVANLVSNALKYSAGDAPVRLSLTGDEDSVTLSVKDEGIGLAEDELSRLFRRYGRAEGAVATGVDGLGLGLFLSKGVVEAHGGRIWAESPGRERGTTLFMVLPRAFPPPPST